VNLPDPLWSASCPSPGLFLIPHHPFVFLYSGHTQLHVVPHIRSFVTSVHVYWLCAFCLTPPSHSHPHIRFAWLRVICVPVSAQVWPLQEDFASQIPTMKLGSGAHHGASISALLSIRANPMLYLSFHVLFSGVS
jgi:hypothetical protein